MKPIASNMSFSELIRLEIDGKYKALERYDSILWKIRYGYLIILYGMFSLMSTRDKGLSYLLNDERMVIGILILVWSFSVCALIVDRGFLLSKLRVVGDLNQLYKISIDLADGSNVKVAELRDLLIMSGESLKKVPRKRFWYGIVWVLPLYFINPIVVTIFFLILI